MAVGFGRDKWYNYIADRSHPPVASAVVEKPKWDPDHVYAWKPANNWKGWKRIDKGEAGVDDASVIQSAIGGIDDGKVIALRGKFYAHGIQVKKSIVIDGYGAEIYSDTGAYIMRIGEAKSTTKVAENVTVKGLVINGMKTEIGGIDVNAVDNVTLEDITIIDCYARGLRLGVWSETEYRKHNIIAKNIRCINSAIVLGGIENGDIEVMCTGVLPGENDVSDPVFGGVSWVDFSYGEHANTLLKNVVFRGIFKDCDSRYSKYLGLVCGLQNVDRCTIYIDAENCKGWCLYPVDVQNKSNGYSNKVYIQAKNVGGGGQIPYWWYNTLAIICIYQTNTVSGFVDDGQNSTLLATIEKAYKAGLVVASNATEGVYTVNCKDNDQSGEGWPDIQVYGSARVIAGSCSGTATSLKVANGAIVDLLDLLMDGAVVNNGTINQITVKKNANYMLESSGTATFSGDGSTTTFTIDITHGLVKDKLVAKITLDREGTVDKVYLVDKDGDGFKETLRVVVTYATAPADGEEVPIYWKAEVV